MKLYRRTPAHAPRSSLDALSCSRAEPRASTLTRAAAFRNFARALRPRGLAAALAFLSVSLSGVVAHAVPPEYFRNIVLHPTDPNIFVLRYESAFGGLFFSRDGGHSLQMVPGQSFYRYDLRRFVPMQFAGDGKLLLALDSGLDIDNGMGCFPPPPNTNVAHYSDPAVAGLWVADLAPHPSDPDTTFLVTTADPKDKGHSGLWKRDKQGAITPFGAADPAPAMPNKFSFIATGLKVVARAASTEGLRFIMTGTTYDNTTATAVSAPVLRVSDNLGMSWTNHPIPDPNKTGGNPRLLYVDGSDPFKALVFLENGFGEDSDDAIDPIFVTKDGGQSFTPYLDKVQVAGEFVALPSGQLLIADRGIPGGLWSAANLDAAPSKIADYAVHCLAYQAKTQKLFMCKLNELGYYDVGANSFCEIFRPSDAASFVSCPSAPLEQNVDGIKQLCGGFCGAAHYSSAPVCSTFTPPAMTNLCGPMANMYDNENADPDKRWIEPPGPGAAARCAGFTGPVPVADAGMPDASAAGTSDAGGGTSSDAGAASEHDAGSTHDAGTSGESEDGGVAKKKHGGCQLAVGTHGSWRSALLSMLALALLIGARRAKFLARAEARASARTRG
jgi:hypothetical protein